LNEQIYGDKLKALPQINNDVIVKFNPSDPQNPKQNTLEGNAFDIIKEDEDEEIQESK